MSSPKDGKLREIANADVGEHLCGRVVWHAVGTACAAVRNEELQPTGTP